jgi:hypothetical protein
MPLTQRDRWEMEEREFTISAVVTKVYTKDITITATSDESARAQFEELRGQVASEVTEDDLEETIVEEEGCYDPISALDD